MNRMKLTCILAAALAAWGLLPTQTRANVQEVSGLSPRATAMGNAFSPIADDFSASYYNPAGLAQIGHHGFFIGYMWVKPYVNQYSLETGDEISRSYENFRSFVIGTQVDLTQIFNITGHNLVLGVATTVGENFKAAWRIHDWSPEVPQFVRLGDEMNRAHIFTSLGFEVLSDMLYVGGGVNLFQNFNPTVNATLNLKQEIISQDMNIKGDFEISPIAGMLFKPWPWLSLAYVYRDSWQIDMPVRFNSTLQVSAGGEPIFELPIEAFIPLQDYFLPWNMTGGVAVRPIERVLLSVDVTFYHWSSYELPEWRGEIVPWNDTVVPRVGAEVRVWQGLVVRGGFYYDPSPVPDQSTVTSNFLDMNKHVFSAGIGYTFIELPFIGKLPINYPLSIDGYYQYQYMSPRTQIKDWELTHQQSWFIEGSAFSLGIGASMGF